MAERVLSARATVMGEFDVVVCGGGPAGVGAAIGAAREGASVLLVEATGCLGGADADPPESGSWSPAVWRADVLSGRLSGGTPIDAHVAEFAAE